LTTLQQCN